LCDTCALNSPFRRGTAIQRGASLRVRTGAPRIQNSARPNWLRLCESEHLGELSVEHPCRKKSGESPVLETLRNDRVACLRFRRAERHVDGFAQTLRG
jgi:hypothetical protein